MPRERLPDRRPCATQAVEWRGADGQPTIYSLTVGQYADGRPGEIFVDGIKVGSTLQALLADAAVIISIALQHGIAPSTLGYSLARVPIGDDESGPASPLGAIIEALIDKHQADGRAAP
jgi:hypothetical protein